MKRVLGIILVLASILTVFTSCSRQDGPSLLYYLDKSEQSIFAYQVRPNGSGISRFIDDPTLSLRLADNWVYYSNYNDNYRLYKIKSDGTGKMKLSDDVRVELLHIKGDWIIFKTPGQNEASLNRVKTDGTGQMQIWGNCGEYMIFAEDWIVFSNGADEGKLYKISLDGNGLSKLSDDQFQFCCADGEWVYYSNNSEGSNVYKVKLDGTEATALNDDASSNLVVNGEWVYYNNESDSGFIYKIRTDGTERTKLTSNPDEAFQVYGFYVSGGWIYYSFSESLGYGHVDNTWRIKTDGTGRKKIGAGSRWYFDPQA